MTVWILHYSHKRGDDITVYGNQDSALLAAVEIIDRWSDEEIADDSIEAEIKALVRRRRYAEAIGLYNESTGENIAVSKYEVHGPPEGLFE